jgi:hypothetical protein
MKGASKPLLWIPASILSSPDSISVALMKRTIADDLL